MHQVEAGSNDDRLSLKRVPQVRLLSFTSYKIKHPSFCPGLRSGNRHSDHKLAGFIKKIAAKARYLASYSKLLSFVRALHNDLRFSLSLGLKKSIGRRDGPG